MGCMLAKETKLRPTNHYLDLIAKVHARGGELLDLSTQKNKNNKTVYFSHKYNSSDIIFTEKLVYNNEEQVLDWSIFVNNEEIKIYTEL